ncbi:MAG: hypothetical protein KDK33_07055 [Leptospiraceae bacterium]|nr:hypothetical protein [Leptospiraceae bacterium]
MGKDWAPFQILSSGLMQNSRQKSNKMEWSGIPVGPGALGGQPSLGNKLLCPDCRKVAAILGIVLRSCRIEFRAKKNARIRFNINQHLLTFGSAKS